MTSRSIYSAKAAEKDYFCLTDVESEGRRRDPYEPNHILKTYDSQHVPVWIAEPVDLCVVSIARYKYQDRDRTIFVSLSSEGDVGFIGKEEGFYEKILGTGLGSDEAEGYGYMRKIRQIGEDLFACGHSGQIYRRFDPGTWQAIHDGVVLPTTSKEVLILEDINGFDAEHVFTVGQGGFVAFSDGKTWRRIDVPTDEWLHAIHVESVDVVWICGRNGTLLRGNERLGFVDLSRIQDNDTFLSIAGFGGKLYLGRAAGVSIYDGFSIQEVTTGLSPELRDGHFVDAVDDVLWSFGYTDIARFDGARWLRYPVGIP